MKRLLCLVCLCVAMPSLLSAQESKKEGDKAKGPPKEITVDLGGGVQLKIVLVPSGEFKMGSGESAEGGAAFFNKTDGKDLVQADRFKDEYPQHRVRITKPFYLGTNHVTRGQFRQFVKDSGYKTDAEKPDDGGTWGWDAEKKTAGSEQAANEAKFALAQKQHDVEIKLAALLGLGIKPLQNLLENLANLKLAQATVDRYNAQLKAFEDMPKGAVAPQAVEQANTALDVAKLQVQIDTRKVNKAVGRLLSEALGSLNGFLSTLANPHPAPR